MRECLQTLLCERSLAKIVEKKVNHRPQQQQQMCDSRVAVADGCICCQSLMRASGMSSTRLFSHTRFYHCLFFFPRYLFMRADSVCPNMPHNTDFPSLG